MTEIIISIVTAIGGWELIRYLINLRSNKRKESAEADSAMANVLKEMQDSYQVFIENAKSAIEDDQKYIKALKEDRRQLLTEREEFLKRIDATEKKVRELQNEVARNGRMVASLRPLICGLAATCKKRQPVTITMSEENDEKLDINPISNGEL